MLSGKAEVNNDPYYDCAGKDADMSAVFSPSKKEKNTTKAAAQKTAAEEKGAFYDMNAPISKSSRYIEQQYLIG